MSLSDLFGGDEKLMDFEVARGAKKEDRVHLLGAFIGKHYKADPFLYELARIIVQDPPVIKNVVNDKEWQTWALVERRLELEPHKTKRQIQEEIGNETHRSFETVQTDYKRGAKKMKNHPTA